MLNRQEYYKGLVGMQASATARLLTEQAMLIQCGDNFNIVLMEPIEDEKVGAVEDQPTEGSNDSNSADGTGDTEETPDPSETPETPKKKLIGAILERGWVSESGKYSV